MYSSNTLINGDQTFIPTVRIMSEDNQVPEVDTHQKYWQQDTSACVDSLLGQHSEFCSEPPQDSQLESESSTVARHEFISVKQARGIGNSPLAHDLHFSKISCKNDKMNCKREILLLFAVYFI